MFGVSVKWVRLEKLISILHVYQLNKCPYLRTHQLFLEVSEEMLNEISYKTFDWDKTLLRKNTAALTISNIFFNQSVAME